MSFQKWSACFCVLAMMGVYACSKSDSGTSTGGSKFKPPAVAPVVNAALPSAYRAASSTAAKYAAEHPTGDPGRTYHDEYQALFKGQGTSGVAATNVVVDNTNAALAKTNIGYLFTLSFNDINNGTVEWQGYLNNQVIQIDERMKDGVMQSAMPCLGNTAKPYTVDLSGIDPMLSFPLGQLQCYGAMGADTTGATTGGMAFGQKGDGCQVVAPAPSPKASPTAASSPVPFVAGNASGGCNFSLMLSLIGAVGSTTTFTSNGGFLVVANLQNAGSTSATAPEYVDAMSISYSTPSQANRLTILRFRAVPALNTFEMYYAATDAGISNAQAQNWAWLGAGFRMISDGVHIYADGQLYDRDGSATWLPFNACLNASDNSVATLDATTQAQCNALANSFSLSSSGKADLTYYELTGTTVGSTIPGPVANTQTTPASTAVVNLLSGAYNVSNVSGAASKTF